MAGGDEPAGGGYHRLRGNHPSLVVSPLWPNLPRGELRPVRDAACAGPASLASAAGAHRRPGFAVVLHGQMVRAQAGYQRPGQRAVAARGLRLPLDGAGNVHLVGLPIHPRAGAHLAAGIARAMGLCMGRMAAEPRGPVLQRRLHPGGAGPVLVAAAGNVQSVLAEPHSDSDPAGAAPVRAAFAGALPARTRGPRCGHPYRRAQPVAVPLALGAGTMARGNLPHGQLVPAGAGAVHGRHRAARAHVPLAGTRHPGLHALPRNGH